MIDQRKLPWKLEFVRLETVEAVAESIQNMTVRGAPAIGAAAGFGLALAARKSQTNDIDALIEDLLQSADRLKAARPTAVNLAWAVDKLMRIAASGEFNNPDDLRDALLAAARQIADDDVAINSRMARRGAALVKDGATILHHCNTGALATSAFGTALGVIRAGWEAGGRFNVYNTETRPWLQGARLTSWEFQQLGIPATLIPDSAAGVLMQKGEVSCVITGADRIAANGDTANKVGTYMLAVLAHENDIPFYIAAPTSTVDLAIAHGDNIAIEERPQHEVTGYGGAPTAPEGTPAYNPAFDVTPHRYIAGIVTETMVCRPPYTESLRRAVDAS